MCPKPMIILYTGNDFLEDSPYEPVNRRLSDIFRLAPIIGKTRIVMEAFPLFLLSQLRYG